MALTFLFLTNPSAVAVAISGKSYTANAAGFISGVTGTDAVTLESAAPLQMVGATGLTADRPNVVPSPPIGGGFNNLYPAPSLGFTYWDTSLTKVAFWVGTQRSSTGWVDQAGAAV
jgi:hypothetical protein